MQDKEKGKMVRSNNTGIKIAEATAVRVGGRLGVECGIVSILMLISRTADCDGAIRRTGQPAGLNRQVVTVMNVLAVALGARGVHGAREKGLGGSFLVG